MTMQVLLGGSTVSVALPASITEFVTVLSPSSANATVTFNSNGSYTVSDGTPSGNWRSPTGTGVGAGYEVRWVTGTGTLTTGTADTWQSLSTSRTYGRSRSGVGSDSATGTIQIRDAVSLAVLASTSASVTAEVVV